MELDNKERKPMIKHIIRQVPDEDADWRFYFDGDCFNANSGDYNNTIFPRCFDHHTWWCCINEKEYKSIQSEMRDLFYEVSNVGYDSHYLNVKEIMEDYNLHYNPKNAHELKEIAEYDEDKSEIIARYMTIKTGKKWDVACGRGYSQGDYVEMVYCTENYTEENASILCDAVLGCGHEYGVIEVDENGNEVDSCWGYFVMDSEAWRDEDIKALFCKREGFDINETQLEMVDGSTTHVTYSYRTA